MLELLFLPFRIIFGIIGGILGLIGGIIGGIFGLLGGIVALAVNLGAVALIVGLLIAVFSKKKKKDTYYVDGEEFTSYYNQRSR